MLEKVYGGPPLPINSHSCNTLTLGTARQPLIFVQPPQIVNLFSADVPCQCLFILGCKFGAGLSLMTHHFSFWRGIKNSCPAGIEIVCSFPHESGRAVTSSDILFLDNEIFYSTSNKTFKHCFLFYLFALFCKIQQLLSDCYCKRDCSYREWPTVTIISNSKDLIGWGPTFAYADWLEFKTWSDHVEQLATLYVTKVSLVNIWN